MKNFSTQEKQETSYCNKYKNDTIVKNLKQISFPKASLRLSTNVTLQIFHYGQHDFISKNLMENSQWENHILTPLINILQQDETLQFIDIGSNLGVFSLAAASLGRQVVAVEAMKETCQRNYASTLINGFKNQIILIQNALSDARGKVTIKKNVVNVGGSLVVNNDNSADPLLLTTMDSIFMDDLMEVIKFNRCIMKIDIEGSEYRALQHADEFFGQLDIPVILFEWVFYKDMNISFSESVISIFMSKGYRPFSSLASKTPDLKLTEYKKWPIDIVWKKLPYLFA